MIVPISILIFGLVVLHPDRIGIDAMTLGIFAVIYVRSFLHTGELYTLDSSRGFWVSHEAMGGKPLTRILRYGIFGHWRAALSQMLVFYLQIAITIEASLSYLGLGAQEPAASLGNIIAAHFDEYFRGHTSSLIFVCLSFAFLYLLPGALLRTFRHIHLPLKNHHVIISKS